MGLVWSKLESTGPTTCAEVMRRTLWTQAQSGELWLPQFSFCLCAVWPGTPLSVILAAGEWKSPAFLAYIDLHQLETDVVISAHMEESDDE